MSALALVASRPFLDTESYTSWELFWYVGGFLVWVPCYVVVVQRAWRHHYVEIPILAAVANVTWEFVWGFTITVPMGWGLQAVYQGACLLDCFILVAVLRFGWKQARLPAWRPWWPVAIAALVAAFTAFYITFERDGLDLPLGSTSAYLDNVMMSALYLWFGLTHALGGLSPVAAWSKGLGTGMVTVFVFLRYPDQRFVQVLAIVVAVLDASYLVVLYARRRGWSPGAAPLAVAGAPAT